MGNKVNKKFQIFLLISVLMLSLLYIMPTITATKYIREKADKTKSPPIYSWRELYGPYDGNCIREWERIYQSTPFPTPGDIKYEECVWSSDFSGPDTIAYVGGPHWGCRNMKQNGESCGEQGDTCVGNDCSEKEDKATEYRYPETGEYNYYHPDCIRDPRYPYESPYAYFLQPTKNPINPGTKRYDYCAWYSNNLPNRDKWGTLWTPNWYCWDAKPDGSPCQANVVCYKGGCCECIPGKTRCSGTKSQTCNFPCNWQDSVTDNDKDGVDVKCGDSLCDHVKGITDSTRDAEEIECSDNLDNDCDGLTDTADDDCAGHCSSKRTHSGSDEGKGGYRHYINSRSEWANEHCASKVSKDTDGGYYAYTTGGKFIDYIDCSGRRCSREVYTDFCHTRVPNTLVEYGVTNTPTTGSPVAHTKNCEDYETPSCLGTKVYKQEWGCSGNPASCNDAAVQDTFIEDCSTKESNYCTNDNKFYRNKWSCFSGACKDENDIPIGKNDDRDAKDKECGDDLCDNSPGVYDSTKTQTETNCGDELDNDCDGPKDGEDSDCAPRPAGVDVPPQCPEGMIPHPTLGICREEDSGTEPQDTTDTEPPSTPTDTGPCPNRQCETGQTSCNGDRYLTCDNGCTWTDKGKVQCKCGVPCPPCQSGVDPPQSQACGNCNTGTQTRTCQNNKWTDWGQCTGEGCSPGAETCSGSDSLTCTNSCTWQNNGKVQCKCGVPCPPCQSGVDPPQSQACGNCNTGTQTRTCQNNKWTDWGQCTGEGCSPGAETCSGSDSLTCTNSCTWQNNGKVQCKCGEFCPGTCPGELQNSRFVGCVYRDIVIDENNGNYNVNNPNAFILGEDIIQGNTIQHEGLRGETETFTVEWKGNFRFEAGQRYKFWTESDDGSWLWIYQTDQNAPTGLINPLVINNAGRHPRQLREFYHRFSTSGWRQVQVNFFEASGHEFLSAGFMEVCPEGQIRVNGNCCASNFDEQCNLGDCGYGGRITCYGDCSGPLVNCGSDNCVGTTYYKHFEQVTVFDNNGCIDSTLGVNRCGEDLTLTSSCSGSSLLTYRCNAQNAESNTIDCSIYDSTNPNRPAVTDHPKCDGECGNGGACSARDYGCSNGKCSFSPVDLDTGESWCNSCTNTRWGIGGMQGATDQCCGDDTDEFIVASRGDLIDSTLSCCSSDSYCNYNSNCFASGSWSGTFNNFLCVSSSPGAWKDGDTSEQVCTSGNSGYTWTGSRCCGDDTGENYNEPGKNITCWNGIPVFTRNYVTNNTNPIRRDIISINGSFEGCNTHSNANLRLLTDSAANTQLINNNPSCKVILNGFQQGQHAYCSPTGVWNRSTNILNTIKVLGWTDNSLQQPGCCTSTQCWNGMVCVNEQSNSASSGATNGYRCINGEWLEAPVKFNWDESASGYCPKRSQCLVNPGSLNSKNGLIENFILDFSSALNNNIQCINNTQYIGDNYCEEGNWSTRTRMLALALLESSSVNSQQNYTLYCDTFSNVLNNFEYSLPSGFNVKTDLITSCTIDGSQQTCTNNFCVVKQGTNILVGTTVNTVIHKEASILEAFELPSSFCDNALTNDGQFHPCQNSVVWYNNKIRAIVFSKNPISLSEQLNFLEKFIQLLKVPFYQIFGKILATKPSLEGVQADLSFLQSIKRFSRLYIDTSGEKSIRGVIETIQGNPYLSIEYTKPSVDVCPLIGSINKQKGTATSNILFCNISDSTTLVSSKYDIGNDVWQDLTSKLRIR